MNNLDGSPEHARQRRPGGRAGAFVGRLIALPMLGVVWIYRLFVSPLLGMNCRFEPGCSDYARQALLRHGGIKGAWLTARRIGRCHPWGGHGYDPVPPQEEDKS